jgi:hypothetical protein
MMGAVQPDAVAQNGVPSGCSAEVVRKVAR